MASQSPTDPRDPLISKSPAEPPATLGVSRGPLRGEISPLAALGWSCLTVALVFFIWYWMTREDHRWISKATLPSPAKTLATLGVKIPTGPGTEEAMDRVLIRNTLVSLWRVLAGFSLAALIGIPVGILAGCFPSISALVNPVQVFGRNVPMAALTALTFAFFGAYETQKVMFIFIATVAFVIFDAAQAIRDIEQKYVDTAYTLGSSRWQVIGKVLIPLAMPSVFNSLRLLFGLAFGYITLAEIVTIGGTLGLGGLIDTWKRRGLLEGIYLILLLIPLVAFCIDRTLYWIQIQLFPYRYQTEGLLARGLKFVFRQIDALRERLIVPVALDPDARHLPLEQPQLWQRMTLAGKAVAAAGLVGLLAAAGSLLTPGQQRVQRSVTISQPANPIYDRINTLKNWEAWSPWRDRQASVQYQGPASGAGSRCQWTNLAGAAESLEISSSERPERVELSYESGDRELTLTFTLQENEDSTRVSWTATREIGWNPVSRYLALVTGGPLGRQLQQGLQQLKAASEPAAKEDSATPAPKRGASIKAPGTTGAPGNAEAPPAAGSRAPANPPQPATESGS